MGNTPVTLGHGQFGRVVQITNSTVVKTSNKRDVTLYREATILRKLDHKYIVKFVKYVKSNDELHLEFAGDQTLYDIVTSNDPIQYNIANVIDAIHYLHNSLVAHLDIKLENIVYNRKTNILKLVDFGLSHVYGSNDSEYSLKKKVGTINYTAPEIFHHHPAYSGFKVDVWSLGVVFYACKTGSFPFEQATEHDFRFVHALHAQSMQMSTVECLHNLYDKACLLRPELVRVIDCMLSVDPKCRPSMTMIKQYFEAHA